MRRLLSRRNEERGAVLVMAVAGIILAMLAGALAVDIGRRVRDKNFDQQVADLAAMDAARKLPEAADVMAAAKNSAKNNGFAGWDNAAFGQSGHDLNVCLGTWNGSFSPSADCQVGSAVRVQANSSFSTIFPFVSAGGVNGKAIAQLASEPEAAFSVGSTLVSLDTQASALDGVLGGMLGETAAGMSVVSYDGLATGNVTLAALQTKLLALDPSVGTPNALLTNDIQVAHLLTATSQVLADQGNTTAKAEVDKIIALGISALLKAKLGDLVSVDTPATNSALSTSINVFQLISGSAQIANGTNFVSVPGVNVTLPGVATVATSLRVIEPAQVRRGKVGAKANTSQVQLRLNIDLVASLVDLRLDFTAASAEVELTDISCDTDPSTIELTPTTSGAAISLFANLGGLLGTLSANGTIAGTPPPAVPPTFDYDDEFAPPVGPSPAYSVSVGAASLGFDPVANLDVIASNPLLGGATAAVIELLLPTVFSGLTSVLSPVLEPVLQALGLDLAAADLMALDIFPPPPACGAPIGQPTLLQ